MPKGHYLRDGVDLTWSDDMDEWLEAQCKTKTSYTDMAAAFRIEFPGERKSRNAILGRAARKGWGANKPSSENMKRRGKRGTRDGVTTPTRVYNQRKAERVALMKRTKAPVVFKANSETPMLRHEGDRGDANSPFGSRRLGHYDPVVLERKKGFMPAIIEAQPLSSLPVAMCESDSCMWPTSEDVHCMEVCGARAEVGAYCARHALVAYRVLPTARRNGTHGKQDLEHTRRIDASQHRDTLDRDGEWLGRMIMDQVVTAPADEPPLMIPQFLESKQA